MRVSIAGLGAAATRGHLPALRELEREGRARVVAACDPDERRRIAVGQALPTFASADEMLRSVDSDLMVIAAPPSAHASLATVAAEHRQHILCEKPAGCTPAQVSELAAIWQRQKDRALAASYQYRFSSPWLSMARVLRAAERSGRQVVMSVEVQRTSTDRRAMSDWRDDPAMGGGFADHAVHFLALGREMGRRFEVKRANREYDDMGREQVSAHLLVGSNLLDLSVSYRAAERSTALMLHCDKTTLRWTDERLTVKRKDRRRIQSFPVPALSDRLHVDTLYGPMYRDLLAGLGSPRWCRERADEAIEVGRCLAMLLAATQRGLVAAPTEPAAPAAEPAALAA